MRGAAKIGKTEKVGITIPITLVKRTDKARGARVFLRAGIQIRHIKNLPPMSFGVSDKEIAATIEKMEGGTMVQSLLLSKEPAYINHFNSIFEELWDQGIDAADRIRDIEGGTDLPDLEIIQNPREGIERAWGYVKKSELATQMHSVAKCILDYCNC